MANTDDTTLVNLNTEQVNKLNNLLTRQTEVIQQVNKVLTLQRTDADNISALQEEMKQLQTSVTEGFEAIENEDTEIIEEVSEDISVCPRYEFHTTNVETEPLDTLSGGYNGVDFIYAKDNSVETMSPGTIVLNGLSEPLTASFIFSSYRYEEANYYEETLKIITPKGAVIAEALYVDEGEGVLSVVPYADYDVHTSWGELRNTKGNKIRIYFDNTEPCKPRKLALVPGFGPDQKKAKLLQEKEEPKKRVIEQAPSIPTFNVNK